MVIPNMPHNPEIEAQLLGTLMRSNMLMERLSFLKPEHFYVPVNQRIFTAIEDGFQQGKLANAMTLKARFDADPDLLELGGAKYLARCCASDLVAGDVAATARFVVELSQRRDLVEYHLKSAEEVAAEKVEVTDHVSQSIGFMEGILDGDRDSQTQTGEEVFEEIVNDLKQKKTSISTGMPRLDGCMGGGLHAGRAYGFAARRKIGKTILASTLSCNLAQNGVKHLFICAEMSSKEIHVRNISRMGKIHSKVFLENPEGISDDLANKLSIASNWAQKNIIYRNAPGLTFDKLRTIVLREIVKKDVKGFILDYWQLVKGEKKGQLTAAHLDAVSQWIADTAKKYGVFAIVMAQINKDGNTRDSEGLGNAFDQVFQIHREDATLPEAWVQTMVSRHTPSLDIGSKDEAGWKIAGFGPTFEEIPLTQPQPYQAYKD